MRQYDETYQEERGTKKKKKKKITFNSRLACQCIEQHSS